MEDEDEGFDDFDETPATISVQNISQTIAQGSPIKVQDMKPKDPAKINTLFDVYQTVDQFKDHLSHTLLGSF